MSRNNPPTLFVSAALAALLSACSGTAAPTMPAARPMTEAPKAAKPAYPAAAAPAPAYQPAYQATAAPAPAYQPQAAEADTQSPAIAGVPSSALQRSAPGRSQHKNLPPRATLPDVTSPYATPVAGGPRPIAGDIRAPIEPTAISPVPAGSTFQDYGVNPPIDPLRDPFSTFALDVDSGAYAIARDYINRGQLPPFEAVRAEEFINYFAQDYTPPTNGTFAILADGAPSPFHRDGSVILRIGVQGEVVPDAQRKPAALTFVIDVSGSMAAENRLGLVKQSLALLVDDLRADDSVAIVVYGDRARVALAATSGRRRAEILNAIYALRTEGSTNTESGLRLGYQLAAGALIPGGINRVILCSDGVANVGNTDAVSLIQNVRGEAPDALMLTTVGFGLGNYNDVFMEQLADKGNGFYAYVDTLEEARVLSSTG